MQKIDAPRNRCSDFVTETIFLIYRDLRVPLSDFFSLSNQRSFTNITTPHAASFFRNYYINNAPYAPTGPDGTDSD